MIVDEDNYLCYSTFIQMPMNRIDFFIYEAPQVEIIEMETEQVLAGSGIDPLEETPWN